MARVALLDVIRPYFFVGMDLGPGVHSVLEMLHVDEYETAWDDDSVVIWGVARIDSEDPSSPTFSPHAGGGADSQKDHSSDIEWHDIAIRFRLTTARRPAGSLPVDVDSITDSDVRTVLTSMGPTSGTAASDFPNTQFRLELLFELVTFKVPGVIGAKLEGWVLVPDPDHRDVKLSLPRVLLILTQDSAADTAFDVKLGSFGAETLDDTDPKIARLLSMSPPYALAPGELFGFGFEKAVLDLSDKHTPPDLLDRFGVGEDWRGIYMPEARIFVSTQRSAGVAFNVGARELLIGLPPTLGLWGDINFDVEFLGDRLDIGLRVYAVDGSRLRDPQKMFTNESAHADRYQLTVPASAGPETENYVLYVDVRHGAAPFVITVVAGEDHPEREQDINTFPDDAFFDNAANHPEDISVLQRVRLFSPDQRVLIRVRTRNPNQQRIIALDVYPDYQAEARLAPPDPQVRPAVLTPTTPARDGTVRISSQTAQDATLTITPANGTVMVDGEGRTVTNGAVRVSVPPDSSHDVTVSWTHTGERALERVTVHFADDYPDENGNVGPQESSLSDNIKRL
jgi:hypothetical protein